MLDGPSKTLCIICKAGGVPCVWETLLEHFATQTPGLFLNQ